MMNVKKIAIIGASTGQVRLYQKARELGYFVIGIAWDKGAICKPLADKFYSISIIEKDKIVDVCREERVCGVVSNASDLTAQTVAYVSEKLGLTANPYQTVLDILDKKHVREVSKKIKGLSEVNYYKYDGQSPHFLPCIVKPSRGGGKSGVSFVSDEKCFKKAILYAKEESESDIMIEEYISGKEISVESISYRGSHYVLQITDKENTGVPHFVETGHHQPSTLDNSIKERINIVILSLLTVVHYENGASHIELKIAEGGNIYLIELNPRGGGDQISNELVYLSTGYDYVKGMIEVATNRFVTPQNHYELCAGIYFLCAQKKERLPFFENCNNQSWLKSKLISSYVLKESKGNRDRNGYVLYQSVQRIPDRYDSPFMQLYLLNADPNAKEKALSFIERKRTEQQDSIASEEWVDKILEKADVITYERDGEIIGWLVLYANNYHTRIAYLAGLYVLSKWRNNHIAYRLLNEAITKCVARGFKELTLYCNNPIAMSLYEKFHFKEIHKEIVQKLGNKEYSFLSLDIQSG